MNKNNGGKKMGLLDMFDKLDDLVYEPMKVLSEYLEEPIKAIDSRRKMKNEQKHADIENNTKKIEVELEKEREENRILLLAEERKRNAEIDDFIARKELERRTDVVEAIKKYQIDLSHAVSECISEIGKMSLELRERANDMVVEKTKQYVELQEKSKSDAKSELKEIEELFGDNQRVKIQMEDTVISQMKIMIETANKFIIELSDDIKRLNKNIDELTNTSQEMIHDYLKPMKNLEVSRNYQQIEQNSEVVIEQTTVDE